MRILLQQKETGLYFTEDGLWGHCGEAKNFISSTTALDYCLAHKIPSVQLVLKFDDQPYDIVWPVVSNPELTEARPARAMC